jgi:hypothetical protein
MNDFYLVCLVVSFLGFVCIFSLIGLQILDDWLGGIIRRKIERWLR